MTQSIRRGEIWLVNLNPTRGSEITKCRPCVVVNVDSMAKLPLRIIVPITEWKAHYNQTPWMTQLDPDSQNGLSKTSAADSFQVRCVDEKRFAKRLGFVTPEELADIVAAIGLIIKIQ